MSNVYREQYMQTDQEKSHHHIDTEHLWEYSCHVRLYDVDTFIVTLYENLFPVSVYCEDSESLSENLHSERNLS